MDKYYIFTSTDTFEVEKVFSQHNTGRVRIVEVTFFYDNTDERYRKVIIIYKAERQLNLDNL